MILPHEPLSKPCEHKKDSFPNVNSCCHNQGAHNLRDTSLKLKDASHSRSISQKSWRHHSWGVQRYKISRNQISTETSCVSWLPFQQWASLPVLVNGSILCKTLYNKTSGFLIPQNNRFLWFLCRSNNHCKHLLSYLDVAWAFANTEPRHSCNHRIFWYHWGRNQALQ